MYKNLGYLVCSYIFFALDEGFFKNFPFFGVLPNLLLLLVIYMAVEDEGNFFLGLAFFSGLILDFATQVFLGSFAVSFFLLALGLRQISQNIITLERNWKFLPLMLLLSQSAVYLWLFLFNGLVYKFGHARVFFEAKDLFNKFGYELLYNLVLMYPVWKFLEIPKILQLKFSGRVK